MALDLAEYMATLEPSAADREQARGMAMWNAAAALIGGGPNRGRNIAQAMLGASQGYQTGLEQARRKRLADLQSLNMAQTMREKEREIRQAADMRGLLNSAGTSIDEDAKSVGPTQPFTGDVREKRRMLLERAAELAQAKGDQVSAARFLADADKLRDEWDVTPRKVMRNGKPVLIQTSKSGKERVMGYEPEPEKLHFGDTGGRAAVGFDQFTGAPVTPGVVKTMSPEAAASNALGWANYNRPQVMDTSMGLLAVGPQGTGKQITVDGEPVAPKMPEAQKKELQSLDSQIAIVDRAINDVKETPSAFGMKRGLATLTGTLSESVAGRYDTPEERKSRAFVYNIVSKVINERAGAAQSKQELARLRTFLPSETDNADQISDKLKGFRDYLGEQRAVYAAPIGKPPVESPREDALTVTTPKGVFKFKTRAEADGFRREAGL